MEFPFDVNYVLPFEITILNGDYRILNQGQSARIIASEKLTSIIDAMGDASYKAQGLSGAVTTARKFRMSEHRLYILKQANANNNSSLIIGILKVGTKNLYIYDTKGQVHQRTPLCVLDFYVHESKQRLGYGKRLFDAMLELEKCAPYELAIDRPSNKCLAFLLKHYNLSAPIHQVNNFVVYAAFFNQFPLTNNKMSSSLKQKHQEWTPWLFPTERQFHRPYSEQNEIFRNHKTETSSSQSDIFANYRQPTINGLLPIRSERSPIGSYVTSYGQHYNQIQPIITHSANYVPRNYSQVFNENHFYGYNGKPVINTNSQLLMNNYRRPAESVVSDTSRSETLNSVYTFPSLIKANNNWRQQQSTIDSPSTAWNLFGVHRLLN